MNITILKVYLNKKENLMGLASKMLRDTCENLLQNTKQSEELLEGLADFRKRLENGAINYIPDDGFQLSNGNLILDFYKLNNGPCYVQFMAIENSTQSKILNFTDILYQFFNANQSKYDIDIKYYSPIIIGGGQNG